MLRYLQVSGLALIQALDLELKPGLTILTGETGAGKSILMDALGLVLGGRASVDMIRDGDRRLVVQASLDPPPAALLADAGLDDLAEPLSCGEVILVREFTREGRGRATVNGMLTPVARLRSLGDLLADIHGQGDQQSLLVPAWQLRYLDAVAGTGKEVEELGRRHARLAEIAREREMLLVEHRERDKRLGYLTFERDELKRASLVPGEEEELLETRRLLGSGEQVAALVAEARAVVSGPEDGEEPGLLDRLGRLAKVLGKLATWSDSLGEGARAVTELEERIGELDRTLVALEERVAYDPAELDRVEGRLHEIDRLKRKYHLGVEELLARLAEVERECRRLEGTSERLTEIDREHAAALGKCLDLARVVSDRRRQAARRVESACTALLGELALPHARVVVAVSDRAAAAEDAVAVDGRSVALGPRGFDEVELLVAMNPSEPPRPLRKVASGGELSRLMLALELILAGGAGEAGGSATPSEGPATLVFDEVDVGVSGRAAEDVGRKLRRLAASKQVLCITHLPQVAAFGHQHVEVTKRIVEGRAQVEAFYLGPDERRRAIARLFAGAEITDAALAQAEALLAAGAQ